MFCRTCRLVLIGSRRVLPGFRTFVQTGIVLQVNGSPVDQSCTGSRPGDRTGRSSGECRVWWKHETPASARSSRMPVFLNFL